MSDPSDSGHSTIKFDEEKMGLYADYLDEIAKRKEQGLSAKPIEGGPLAAEVIAQIKDTDSEHRKDSLD